MARTKTQAVETAQNNTEFNVYNYVKGLIVKSVFENTDEIKMRASNNQVLDWLQKVGAIGSYQINVDDTNIDEEGKRFVCVKIKNVNLKATAKSKEGKDFNVFSLQTIGHYYLQSLK